MDNSKVGALIYQLRNEKNMTQQQIGDLLNVSNKTVSKWETGKGCPDISLLAELSAVFGVNIEQILEGDLNQNEVDGGNRKRIKFYICPVCGNVITATGQGEISCCGRKLLPLEAKAADQGHQPKIEKIENDYYVTFEHEMRKEHYLSFAAYVTYDRVLLIKLYPEQAAEVRFPQMSRGKLYIYCNQHGLLELKL